VITILNILFFTKFLKIFFNTRFSLTHYGLKNMEKKIIGICICMLLIATSIPSIGAIPIPNAKPVGNENKVFKNCFIEALGLVDSSPPSNRPIMFKILYLRSMISKSAFVLYWLIIFEEPDVTVTIYSEENGEVLWQNEHNPPAVWGLRLIRFKGQYTHFTDENGFHVNIRGNVGRAIASTGD
jgi:hypothetical protein